MHHFNRLWDSHFSQLPSEKINSSGYVVDTLEAAIWCLENTKNYKECVLKAVNLGEDTDTVAAIAGAVLPDFIMGLTGFQRVVTGYSK